MAKNYPKNHQNSREKSPKIPPEFNKILEKNGQKWRQIPPELITILATFIRDNKIIPQELFPLPRAIVSFIAAVNFTP